MRYINKNILKTERKFDQYNRKDLIRLDLNENQCGLPNSLIRRVIRRIDSDLISQYPDTDEFETSLSNRLTLDKKNICITNGSSEAIRYAIEGFTSENGEIVGVVPSYFMFQVYSMMYGRKFVSVEYSEDMSMDVSKIIDKLSEKTQMLILLNPNNPVGNIYSDDEIEKLLNKADELDITVIIDEAYYGFCNKILIDEVFKHKHVILTRSFSKLFSMAGCRLGYAVGREDDIKIIRKLCTPHNTNILALKLGEAVINDKVERLLINNFSKARSYLIDKLNELSYDYIDSKGNFIFIKTRNNAKDVVEKMKGNRILIKSYDNIGKYGDVIRVTISNIKYMKKFIEKLKVIDR